MTEDLIGSVTLSQIPFSNPDPNEILKVLLQEIRQRGIDLLPWDEEARQVQARVGFMRIHEGKSWPDFSDQALAADLDWLAPFCSGIAGLADLKQLEMRKVLLSQLPWDLTQQLEKDAPTHMIVPSGSRKKLRYTAGEPPVLAVRLQEMFGQRATPTICKGKVRIMIHLLSPANRPIQITSDLESFWHMTYSQVRKEMAGRYPKHYWPEDPFLAKPTSLTKKALLRKQTKTSR